MEKRSQIVYLKDESLQKIKDVKEYLKSTEGQALDDLIQKGYEWFRGRKPSRFDPFSMKESFSDFIDEAEKACEGSYRKEINFYDVFILKGILDYINNLEEENKQREKANEFLLKKAWREM